MARAEKWLTSAEKQERFKSKLWILSYKYQNFYICLLLSFVFSANINAEVRKYNLNILTIRQFFINSFIFFILI